MKFALFGLGKMGVNIARRLCRGGIEVVGYNRSQTIVCELAADEGLVSADSPAAAAIAALMMPYALFAHFTSQDQAGYGNRLLSMMCNAFGGHASIRNDNAARVAQGVENA